MADQVPLSAPDRLSSDIDPFTSRPLVKLVRHDTTSSSGSAKPIPVGHWRLNLSGNCPGCHHHHNSVKVHVKASSDSNHVGDVYCDNCERLWLGFGKRNSTRLSLLSMKTIEPEPLEKAFHSTLVHMIRSATAVATLSSTLADIPESSSADPSRETSVRSTPRHGVRGTSQSFANNVIMEPVIPLNSTTYVQDANSSTSPSAQRSIPSLSKPHTAGTSQLVARFKNKIRERLPMLDTSRLGRWIKTSEEKKLSPNRRGKQPFHKAQPSLVAPTVHVSPARSVEAQVDVFPIIDTRHNEVNVCTPSTTAAEALESLKTLDQEAIRAMTLEQSIDWMRGQLTDFKRYAPPLHPSTTPLMVNTGAQVDPTELQPDASAPPTRRHSALAFLGNGFGSFQYWEIFRGSNATLNGRPLSMSETHLSDADTAVEGMSVTSAPRHILVESLQRDRRGSSSPRPRSFQGFVQNWQQIHHSRAEARRSFDSAATGGAVRSITPARGRARNRLSRASMGRTSTIYVTEPSMSQVQLPLPTNEESEQSHNLEHYSSPSPSPPTPR